jgi:hypothetical protein
VRLSSTKARMRPLHDTQKELPFSAIFAMYGLVASAALTDGASQPKLRFCSESAIFFQNSCMGSMHGAEVLTCTTSIVTLGRFFDVVERILAVPLGGICLPARYVDRERESVLYSLGDAISLSFR